MVDNKNNYVVERYYNDKGEVGVIYSPGHGAGWSTWSDEEIREFMIFDKTLVKLVLENDLETVRSLVDNRADIMDVHAYTDADKLEVVFFSKGNTIHISECHGYESVCEVDIQENTYKLI